MYHTFCKSQPPILLIFSKILLKTILSPTFQITAFNNIIKSQRKATRYFQIADVYSNCDAVIYNGFALAKLIYEHCK